MYNLTIGQLREVLDQLPQNAATDALPLRFGYQPNYPLECGVSECTGIGMDTTGTRCFYLVTSGNSNEYASADARALLAGDSLEEPEDPYENDSTHGRAANL